VNILAGMNGLFILNFVWDRLYIIHWHMCFETVSSV